MFRSVKKPESHISVDLEDPLTSHSCSQLIIEIMKYIMYQKQQIPLSCDALMKLHANSKPTDRNFSTMQSLINSLCNVSNNLASQFTLDGCDVKEVVIIIGATIVSPKLCIRVELPTHILSSNTHLECHHSFRKPLLTVMRTVLQSVEFQDEMAAPLGPTNTFVLVQKKDPHKISEFFLPKPQFDLSSHNTTTFRIRLRYSENNLLTCNCDNLVKVYQDSSNGYCKKEDCIVEKSNNYESAVSYQWYQSKEVFRGFKFLRH